MSIRATLPARPIPAIELDDLVATIKGLAMDAVEAAGCGHPGMPMGCADAAAVLWSQFLVHDPDAPDWPDRDRFVLSAGHGSMLLYALLHLTGYALTLDDLRAFRQWQSRTPGHPEHGETVGVEVTTGPLGTGFATGVGMALAERILAARYNRSGHEIVDHLTWGIVSDGDLMEGVAAEAASLAGHLGLGKLVYLYDDNHITIDGGTERTFTEDVAARFSGYGWHVVRVDGHDRAAVADALDAARRETNRPSLVCMRTVIAAGSPGKAGTSAAHGAKLGADEVRATKQALGIPLEPAFFVPERLRRAMEERKAALAQARSAWVARLEAYRGAHPELARELEDLWAGRLPKGVLDDLPTFAPGTAMATRKAGARVLSALAARHPGLVGGSADLAESNGVVVPELGLQSRDRPDGREIAFGVREHAMAAMTTGLTLHGGLRGFCATFLVFSDFMRGALRLSAVMAVPNVFVFTHDSFHVGEDGPTHQPVEHVMSLRLIPGLHVVRPADATETAGAWAHALRRGQGQGPTALILTRQNLPVLEHSRADAVERGAYVLWDPPGEGELDGILIATGSEVALALSAARSLADRGTRVRLVSMPCWEAFDDQSAEYRDRVLPPRLRRRLAVEAGATLGWQRHALGSVGLDRFGASAPAEVLATALGFTVERVVAAYDALPRG